MHTGWAPVLTYPGVKPKGLGIAETIPIKAMLGQESQSESWQLHKLQS